MRATRSRAGSFALGTSWANKPGTTLRAAWPRLARNSLGFADPLMLAHAGNRRDLLAVGEAARAR